jgi:hypothetical protein
MPPSSPGAANVDSAARAADDASRPDDLRRRTPTPTATAGEQRVARLLSAHTTCRLQHRPLHAYLADALAAHNRGDPVPLLT